MRHSILCRWLANWRRRLVWLFNNEWWWHNSSLTPENCHNTTKGSIVISIRPLCICNHKIIAIPLATQWVPVECTSQDIKLHMNIGTAFPYMMTLHCLYIPIYSVCVRHQNPISWGVNFTATLHTLPSTLALPIIVKPISKSHQAYFYKKKRRKCCLAYFILFFRIKILRTIVKKEERNIHRTWLFCGGVQKIICLRQSWQLVFAVAGGGFNDF